MTVGRTGRGLVAVTGATAAVAVAAWTALHRSADPVRAWRPSDRTPLVGAGPLHAEATAADLAGDGPVVVLLHGIAGSSRSFGRAWDDLGAPTVAVDVLGFGRSFRHPASGYGRAAHVAAVRRTLRALGLGDRRMVYVGHSMGAVLALHLAATDPTAAGVVAMSAPLYDGEDEGLARIGAADPLAKLLDGRGAPDIAQKTLDPQLWSLGSETGHSLIQWLGPDVRKAHVHAMLGAALCEGKSKARR